MIWAMPKTKRESSKIKNEKLRMHIGSRVDITPMRQKVTMTFSKSRDVTSGIITWPSKTKLRITDSYL